MGKNLSVYENGDPYFIKNNELLSKIVYLINNVQINLYEIIGYLNIRSQFYLSKDESFISEKLEKPLKPRNGKEFEESIDQILYGFPNGSLDLDKCCIF